MRLTHKTILAGMMASLVAIVASSFLLYSYSKARESYLDKEIELLSTIADTYSNGLEILLDSYIDKAGLVASRTQLRKLLNEHNRSGVDHGARMARILQDAASGDDDIALLSVFDTRARLVAHTAGRRALDDVERDFIAQAVARGQMANAFVETWIEQDSIQLVIYVPMLLDGKQIGFLQSYLTPSAFDRTIQRRNLPDYENSGKPGVGSPAGSRTEPAGRDPVCARSEQRSTDRRRDRPPRPRRHRGYATPAGSGLGPGGQNRS